MKLLACIIETRPVPELTKCINDHLKMLPDDVDLKIFHSKRNDYIRELFGSEKCSYVTVNHELDYNKILTSADFWKGLLDYDRVLIFQTDSVIFRPGIEEFYEWDYVGAPWKFQDYGGNGGLSLRNPRVMYDICSKHAWGAHLGNEDVFFSNLLFKEGLKLAPRAVCSRFSVESIFTLHSFGGHAYWKHLPEIQTNQIKYQYE